MNDIINETIQDKKSKSFIIKKNFIVFRWILLLIVIPVFLFASDESFMSKEFWICFSSAVVYNSLVTSLLVLNKSKWAERAVSIVFYMDIVVICTFSYVLGGIQSDIYFILFFIIAYYGTGRDVSDTVFISIFALLMYSISSIFYEIGNLSNLNYLNLIIRGIFIIFAAYGISGIIIEVKKYDELHKKEFKRARTDKLTGLANRHYFDQKLEEEALYAEYSRKPLNILMFDIDNFKVFNDSYGHLWGDKLLALFGDIIIQSIRKTDIPVRYGGEEFIILIRDLDLEIAKSVGERIRCQLERQNMYLQEGDSSKKVTVSCGIAQFPTHSNDIKKVVEYSDKALYYAKEIGKNVVVCYDEIGKLDKKDFSKAY
ncbi:UNVERIFIED_CONTAM: diguanylate cyclase (GGDEF)-like protein [Acetivibrio alkalicellulosi]